MLYLEDYLEMIEHLPMELRDRFTEIRELDLQVHNAMDSLEDEVKTFFSNAKRMKTEVKTEEYSKIKSEYVKTLEDAEEKVGLASQIYDLVDRYLRRLDQELAKFKIELEADNSGITELLERRSLELDNPHSSNNFNRDRRRLISNHNSGVHMIRDSYSNPNSASGFSSYPHHGHHHGPTLNSLNSNMGSNRLNVLSPSSFTSGMISPASSTTSNGNNNNNNSSAFNPSNQLTPPLHLGHSMASHNSSSASGFNPMAMQSGNPSLGGGGGGNPIAAAASQAIAATQSMAAGRRTASLKASIDAIHTGPGLLGLSSGDSYMMSAGQPGFSGLDSNRGTKRMRTSSHFHDDSDSESNPGGGLGSGSAYNGTLGDISWNHDPDEPRYCICQQVSYGEMVACDNADCEIEWFHYACVQLASAPKGKWYCPPCTTKMRRKNRA